MKLSDFDYKLPKELIAQHPVYPRSSSRLMVLGEKIEHRYFSDILDYLKQDDVLVLNETKVIPARMKGRKETGTKVELLIEKCEGNTCECGIKAKKPRVGNILIFNEHIGEIIAKKNDRFVVRFDSEVENIMKEMGEIPTPPYIKETLRKNSDYQTVYSKKKGAIAAPTAGLHFTEELLEKIRLKGIRIAKICLHVSFGTFLPVRDIKKHKMHPEYYEIDKRNADIINKRKGRLFVVGTTCVRALESAANKKGKIMPKKEETRLFIKPGYRFKTKINAIITNFHLPKSTLLMLVSAFIGRDRIMQAYKIAIKNKYRFYSFGDSMLLFKE